MTSIRATSPLAVHIAGAALCAGLLGACASPPAGPADQDRPVPAALQPAAGEHAIFTWHAVGSQIYECRVDKAGWAWVFVAPEADLFNQKDEKVGTHGAGPHWTARDGSRTVGTLKARADGERPADIPLLLLTARSDGASGRMAGVTSVQRLHTQGGNAPATGCAGATDVGRRIRQGYTADYVFFGAHP